MVTTAHPRGKTSHPEVERQALLELHADGRPILRGFLNRAFWLNDQDDPRRDYMQLQIKVWCPFCKSRNGRPGYHLHGWLAEDDFTVLQHKWPHCLSNHPLLTTGYYVALDPDAQHVVVPGVPQFRPARRRRRPQIGSAT